MVTLQLSFLGQVSVTVNQETAVHFPMKSIPALLVYLAEHGTKHRHARGMLAELLWPGMAPKYGRKNLRQTLYELNKLLPETDGGPLILATRQFLQRNPGAVVEIDTQRFEQALQNPSLANIKRAIIHYQGDFLADFYLPDSTAFENWAQNRREYYRRRYREALHSLITLDPGDAATYARRLLDSDPLDENAARRLMSVLAEQGERAEALKLFDRFQEQLQDEIGIEPSPETQMLVESIRANELVPPAPSRQPSMAEDPPTLPVQPRKAEATDSIIEQTSPTEIRHNLPSQPTPFLGRETELAAVEVFIADPNVRLVTIVGAGGMGKTRLALALAERWLTAESPFPDGVFFINLAPLDEVEQVAPALADALDFPMLGSDDRSPQQQLLAYLRHKKMLLLFDNFEHLLAGATLVTDILLAAQEVQILVTSRERLQLRLEQVYLIEGLEFPDWEAASLRREDVDAEGSAVVQLFLQSARRNQPDFALHDGDDLAYLARICRTVSGMPLALELAASWVDMLPLVEIAAELQRGLDFLETDMRDMPERHRSVRAVIGYSWQKLDGKERDIFARLSLFRGGFTREAAQAVAGANLRQLARLVNKSLVQGGGKDGRYRIHALLRKYGAEKLAEDGEREMAVRQQHSHFYCATLQKREADLTSVRQQTALVKMEADYQNIVTAWNEALSQGHLTQLVNAVNGLGEFYDAAGRWREGVATMEKSAEQVQAVYGETPTTATAARLLVWLWAWRVNLSSTFSVILGGPSERPLVQHFLQPGWDLLAHPVLADLDTRAEKAFVQLLFGRILFWSSQYEKGQEYLTASFNLYRTLNDVFHVAEALWIQHLYATVEDTPEQGYRLGKESLALFRQVGEPRRIVSTLCFLAQRARNLTAFAEAARYLDEAFSIAQAATYHLGTIEAHLEATNLAWYQGQFDLALTHNKKALVWAESMNSPVMLGACAGSMAVTQIYHGQFSEAISMFQEAAELNPDNWALDMQPMAHVHAGDYETAESLLIKGEDHISFFPWVRLTQADYAQALSLAQQRYDQFPLGEHEHRAWVQIPMAFALYKLDRVAEARRTLYQCLQTCLAIQAFRPLMQVMPIIPVLLADGADDSLQERAVEIYALAESLPFVSKAQLFADLAGKPMAAVRSALPANVVAAAEARGRELDWWQTAESLLTELTELGWGEEAEKQDDSRAA